MKATIKLVMCAGLAVAASPASAQVLFNNGPVATGATTLSGAAAPAGGQWSECGWDSAGPQPPNAVANTTAGFGAQQEGATNNRMADDFVVPTGQTWVITAIEVQVYETGAATPTITAASLRIFGGGAPGTGSVLFGDLTTNRISQPVTFADTYRVFNTFVAATCGGATTPPGTTRRLQNVRLDVNPPLTLTAGTYWVDMSFTGSASAGPWMPSVTVVTTRQPSGASSNALQSTDGSGAIYLAANDTGQGCGPVPLQQEIPFRVIGTTAGGCYPNCDGSTGTPSLTPADFVCFLNKFRAGDAYANCDGSTGTPALTPADFVCFLNKFRAGC